MHCWDLIKAKELRHHQKYWKVLWSQSHTWSGTQTRMKLTEVEPPVMFVARMNFWWNDEMVPYGRLQGLSGFLISSPWLSLYPAGAFVLDRAGIYSKFIWKRQWDTDTYSWFNLENSFENIPLPLLFCECSGQQWAYSEGSGSFQNPQWCPIFAEDTDVLLMLLHWAEWVLFCFSPCRWTRAHLRGPTQRCSEGLTHSRCFSEPVFGDLRLLALVLAGLPSF